MPFGFGRRDISVQEASWRRVGNGLAADLLTKGGASPEVIAAAETPVGTNLPPSLSAFIEQADGAEGWVADEYLAMWPVAQLPDLNTRARIADFAPTLVAFATNGAGEGYFFDRATGAFINSPMIGLGDVEPTPIGASFDAMLTWIAAANPAPDKPHVPDPTRFGLVIEHECAGVATAAYDEGALAAKGQVARPSVRLEADNRLCRVNLVVRPRGHCASSAGRSIADGQTS